MFEPYLLLFGIVLWVGVTALILSLFGEASKTAAPKGLTELAKLQAKLEAQLKAKSALEQQCVLLRQELQQQSDELNADFQAATFEQLQTLLTNYPTAVKMAQVKPDLPAKNLIALFTPLENLLTSWGYETIGKTWEQVSYNPQWHQADTEDLTPGEAVYIRFVGYKNGDRLLVPAQVSRTLPGESNNQEL